MAFNLNDNNSNGALNELKKEGREEQRNIQIDNSIRTTKKNNLKKILSLLGLTLFCLATIFFVYKYLYPSIKTISSKITGSPYLDFYYSPKECGTSEQGDSINWSSNNSIVVNKRIELSGACSFTISGDFKIEGNILILLYKPNTEGMCFCANQPTLTWKVYNLPSNKLEIKIEVAREKQTNEDKVKSYWEISDSGVYYKTKSYGSIEEMFGGGGEEQKILLKNAEPNSFIAINEVYGKDANHIFCKTDEIKEADINTFQFTADYRFSKDKNNVYFCEISTFGDSTNKSYRRLDADPESFMDLPYRYSKDKNHVYWDDNIIEGADPTTFIVYEGEKKYSKNAISFDSRTPGGEYLAEDKNYRYMREIKVETKDGGDLKNLNQFYSVDGKNVYYQAKKIEEADLISFQALNGKYAKDKNYVYMEGKKNTTADTNSFQVLSEAYAKDKKYVYREYIVVEGADPNTFVVFNSPWNRYAKDKNRVYCDGKDNFYKGADPVSFEHLMYIYSKDKNKVYYNCNNTIEGADPQSFKALTEEFATDKNYAYYNDGIIAGADSNTFEVVDKEYKVTKDKNNVYIYGKAYPDIDADTFKYLGFNYCLDQNNVYEEGRKIEGSDTNSFKVLDYGYTKDKNHVFCRQTGVCEQIIKDADPSTFILLTEEELKKVNWEADAKDKNYYYKIGRQVVLQ